MAVLWLMVGGSFMVAIWWAFKRLFRRAETDLPAEDPHSLQVLMERCRGRIHRLEAKRQALSEMIDEAEDLKYRLAGSEVHRSRVSLMDRSLRLLHHEANLIDQLLGRYYRQHHALELAVEADRFQQRFERITDGLDRDLLQFREEIDRLDEEYQQLILETEAQVEVENLLRLE